MAGVGSSFPGLCHRNARQQGGDNERHHRHQRPGKTFLQFGKKIRTVHSRHPRHEWTIFLYMP